MLETDTYTRVDEAGITASPEDQVNLAVSFLSEEGRLAWLFLASLGRAGDAWHVVDPLQGRIQILEGGRSEVIIVPKPLVLPELPCMSFACEVSDGTLRVWDPEPQDKSLYACKRPWPAVFSPAIQVHVDQGSSEFPAFAQLAARNELIRAKVEAALQGTPLRIKGQAIRPYFR